MEGAERRDESQRVLLAIANTGTSYGNDTVLCEGWKEISTSFLREKLKLEGGSNLPDLFYVVSTI